VKEVSKPPKRMSFVEMMFEQRFGSILEGGKLKTRRVRTVHGTYSFCRITIDF